MKKENNNINYTAKDIHKYLNAELSDSEMQAMEKAALSDPFLADAMEGFEESRSQAESFDSGVEQLKQRIEKRINKNERKTGVLFMRSKWKVAAAILFILGATIFTLRYTMHNPSVEIAIQPAKDSGTNKSVPPIILKNTDTVLPQVIVSSPEKMITKDKPPRMVETEKKKSQPAATVAKTAKPEELSESTETISPLKKSEQLADREKSTDVQLKDQTPGLRISSSPAVPENYIKGVVVDKKGKPISDATVKIKGIDKGTFTDRNGYFKLYTDESRLAKLIVSHPPRYESVSANIEPDSNLLRTIEMESSTDDVNADVSAGAVQSMVKRNHSFSIAGMDSLIKYINTNKKISTVDSLLHGEEIISFIVNKDGIQSSFKIEKSISAAHDIEILHLIKSGPPLKTTNEKKQRVQVNILF